MRWLGKYFINFYSLFYNYFPYFDKFRAPIFIIIIFQFCLYIFAAIGLKNIPNILNNKYYSKHYYLLLFVSCFIILFNSQIKANHYPSHKIENNVETLNKIKTSYIQSLSNTDLNNEELNDLSNVLKKQRQLSFSQKRITSKPVSL